MTFPQIQTIHLPEAAPLIETTSLTVYGHDDPVSPMALQVLRRAGWISLKDGHDFLNHGGTIFGVPASQAAEMKLQLENFGVAVSIGPRPHAH